MALRRKSIKTKNGRVSFMFTQHDSATKMVILKNYLNLVKDDAIFCESAYAQKLIDAGVARRLTVRPNADLVSEIS
jgi:hypothetical protein